MLNALLKKITFLKTKFSFGYILYIYDRRLEYFSVHIEHTFFGRISGFEPISHCDRAAWCALLLCFNLTLHKLISNNIDRPTKHPIPLTNLTNLSSEWKVG